MNAFQVANGIIRTEVQRDLNDCEKQKRIESEMRERMRRSNTEDSYWPVMRTESYFKDNDLAALDQVNSLELDGDFTALQLMLVDNSYLHIWRTAVDSLMDHQGSHYDHLQWKFSKHRALDILERRDIAAELLEEIEDELRIQTFDVYDGILTKIKMLERFAMIYDAQPSPVHMDHNPPSEPLYQLYPLKIGRRGQKLAEAYPQREGVSRLSRSRAVDYSLATQAYSPTLTSIVSITILVAIIPMGIAWKLSANSKGSTTDVDFYLLIQSSMMSVLGIFTAIYPSSWQPSSHAGRWSSGFAIIGILCASVAIPLYLYLSVMWSALASFVGTAVQNFMTLQLATVHCSYGSHVKKA